MKFIEQWSGTAQTIRSQNDTCQHVLLALKLSGQGLRHAIHDRVGIVKSGAHQSMSNQSGGSSSSIFNDESAPSGLFIVRKWAPGRKMQHTLGSREPTPLGVQGRPVTISQNKPKAIIKHCAPDAFLFSDPI